MEALSEAVAAANSASVANVESNDELKDCSADMSDSFVDILLEKDALSVL